ARERALPRARVVEAPDVDLEAPAPVGAVRDRATVRRQRGVESEPLGARESREAPVRAVGRRGARAACRGREEQRGERGPRAVPERHSWIISGFIMSPCTNTWRRSCRT